MCKSEELHVRKGWRLFPKADDYFQNWSTAWKERLATISKNGRLFFWARNPVRRFYFLGTTIPPRLALYNIICQEGWGNSRPFGSAHCIGAPLPNGLLSPPAALRSEASKRSCRELSPGPRRVPCFHIFTCLIFFCFSVLFIFHTALPLLRARFIKSVAPRPRNASFAPV